MISPRLVRSLPFSLAEVIRSVRPAAQLWILLGVIALSPSPSDAAEVQLRNGDRLTGEITRRENGRIHLFSALFGNVVIAESDIASLIDPQIPVESLVGLPPVAPSASSLPAPNVVGAMAGQISTPEELLASTRAPTPPAPVATAANPETATTTGATTAATTPPSGSPPAAPAKSGSGTPAPRLAGWRGTIEFGFQQEGGRREGVSTALRADAERERGPNQLKVNVRSLYSELDDQLISERSDASFRWRRQLSKRVFAQSVTSFLSDNIKAIDQNYEQNAGFGYALIKRDRHVINVGGGVTGQFRDALRLNEGFAVLGEVFEDYTFRINSRLTFVQDFLAQYSPASRGDYLLREGELVAAAGEVRNYRIRVNSALQGKVTESISMNLRFEYDLDNTVIEQSAKADQRLISSIGYAF